jgi:hypothetical protein
MFVLVESELTKVVRRVLMVRSVDLISIMCQPVTLRHHSNSPMSLKNK